MSVKELIYVGFVTCLFSFWIQTFFYLWYRFVDHELIKNHKSVVHYTSGVIGDGLLVPLTNVFCALTIYSLGNSVSDFSLWPGAFFGGVIITFIFHYYQQKLKLTNWTMPEVGKWNLLGIYHAIFMCFESSFLTYTFLVVLKSLYFEGFWFVAYSPVKYSFLVLGLFAITFLFDYRKPLKIIR